MVGVPRRVLVRLRSTATRGSVSGEDEDEACDNLEVLRTAWLEIQPTDDLRTLAGRLLRVHPLRAADALQLAAALTWAGSRPSEEFVTLDERLRETARLEGLTPAP